MASESAQNGRSAPLTWRYSLPNLNFQGCWAIIFMDSEGCFAALSDYGNVAYRWNPCGMPPGKDLRSFILGCDDGYLTAKFGSGRNEYDPEKTLRSVKDAIVRARRDLDFPKDAARDEMDALALYNNLETEADFTRWVDTTDIGDAYEFYCTRKERDVTAFVERVMPRLREMIRADVGHVASEVIHG